MKSRILRSALPAAVALAAPLLAAHPAHAESHKVLVLQSEGRVDAATRKQIDAAVLKLASTTEPQTAAGELNFSDAATAVGCKPDTALCKDEVLGMLSVDEIVVTTIDPKPGGLEITVKRFTKGGGSRDASMVLATGAPPDKLDGIAPLFGGPAPATPPPGPANPPGPGATSGAPMIPPPNTVGEPAQSPIVQPAQSDTPTDAPWPHHRLELAGMATGGGMFVLGIVFWGVASGTQSDINKAPTRTQADLMHLKDLESKGDGYATAGNVLAISGIIVGGLSTYFYFRDRHAAASSPRVTPAVFDHGAGLMFTMGGTP